jgi:hypothetical protein
MTPRSFAWVYARWIGRQDAKAKTGMVGFYSINGFFVVGGENHHLVARLPKASLNKWNGATEEGQLRCDSCASTTAVPPPVAVFRCSRFIVTCKNVIAGHWSGERFPANDRDSQNPLVSWRRIFQDRCAYRTPQSPPSALRPSAHLGGFICLPVSTAGGVVPGRAAFSDLTHTIRDLRICMRSWVSSWRGSNTVWISWIATGSRSPGAR